MTDNLQEEQPGQNNQDRKQGSQQSGDDQYGLADDGAMTSGSAAGGLGSAQQDSDDGMASDAMGSGSGSDLMDDDDTDIAKVGDNMGVTGGS